MSSGSIQNDFVNISLVPALLNAQDAPACILKIENNLITIEHKNDKFTDLVRNGVAKTSTFTLQDLYCERKILWTITQGIQDAVATMGHSQTPAQLCLGLQCQDQINFLVENNYLFSQEKASYVLHKLEELPNKEVSKPNQIVDGNVFQYILENTTESIIILDKDLDVIEFSQQSQILIEKYSGLRLEKGRSIVFYIQEQQSPLDKERYARVLRGNTEQTELFIPRTDGGKEKISLTYKPLRTQGDAITGVFISALNVTEKTAMENALSAQDIDLSLIYNHLSETIFMIDIEENDQFRFTSVNRAFLENTGLSESFVVGRLVEEVIPVPYLEPALAQYRQAVETKEPVTREERAEYPSGVRISVITVTPCCDKTGKCIKIIGSIHDITARVRAEKILAENSMKLQGILDSSPDVVCTLSREGVLKSVSAAAERLLGYPLNSLINRSILDFVDKPYHQSTREFLRRALLGEDTTNFENELTDVNGLMVPVVWSAHWSPLEQQIYCTVRDATEKKIADKMLTDSEKRFKAMVQDGSDMIAILDDTANYLYVSPSSKSVLDFEPEIFLGRNAFEFIHPEDIEKANQEFATAAGKKKVSLSPFRFRHNNGSWRYVQTVITDLRETPAIRGFVANSRDVTDAVKAQRALEASNERYRYVSRATSDAIWDYNVATSSLLWGEGFLKMFGYSQYMLDSDIQTWNSRIHPEDAGRVERKLEAFFRSEETNWRDDYRFLKADGNYAHVVDKGFVIRDTDGLPVRMIGAMQDITIRKKEESRLRVLESVVTNTIDAVVIAQIRPSGKHLTQIVFVNKAFERMTGYRTKEVEGRSPWFLQGSGSERAELEKLIYSIQNNKPYQGTITNYKKNGAEIWVSYSVTPVTDGQGNYTHWIAILRDVTEAKKREFQQALLADVNRLFNKENGLRETVITVLSKISEFGNLGFAALWTNDSLSGQLELTASQMYYPYNAGLAENQNVSMSKFYALQIKNNGRQGYWKITDNRDELLRNDIKQLWGMPLFHSEKLIGVLLMGTKSSSDFDLSHLPENFGNYLGTELHRKKLEQDLEHIFNLAPDIIAITDFEGNFKKLNPAASNLLGFSIEEFLSRPLSDFLHPEEKPLRLEQLSKLRESGSSYYIEERYLTKDGRSKWLAWTSQPLEDERLVYSVAKDITDKKELEQLLLNSNSLARIGSWEMVFPEKKVSWSVITREIMHAKLDYIPRPESPLGEFYPQDAMEMMNGCIRGAIDLGTPWDEVLQVRTISGGLKWVRSIGSTEQIDGECLRVFGSLQDVDLQVCAEISAKEARAELEESEKRYSELFHLSPLPMWVYDFETLDFLDVNQTAIASYGFSRTQFLSMNIRDIRPSEDIEQLEKTLRKTRKQEGNIFRGIFRHLKQNGEVIQVDIKSNTIIFKGRKAKVIIANDITERLKQFQAIEARNEKLREVAWIQSHKLRAPLAKIMGLVQMLSGKINEDPAVGKILAYIDNSAQELDQVVREVVSKSEELDKTDL